MSRDSLLSRRGDGLDNQTSATAGTSSCLQTGRQERLTARLSDVGAFCEGGTTMQIGILTGGGDCGGLNAAIRAIVLRAAHRGHTVIGVADGWAGLLEGRAAPLSVRAVSGISGLGGTILGSSRTNPERVPDGL